MEFNIHKWGTCTLGAQPLHGERIGTRDMYAVLLFSRLIIPIQQKLCLCCYYTITCIHYTYSNIDFFYKIKSAILCMIQIIHPQALLEDWMNPLDRSPCHLFMRTDLIHLLLPTVLVAIL